MENIKVKELISLYLKLKNRINRRLNEFKSLYYNGSEKDIFRELVFCLLTPQSKAKLCWETVQDLNRNNLIFKGNRNELSKLMNKVRFKNNKAEYIIKARKLLTNEHTLIDRLKTKSSVYEKREWLVDNVKGFGYKEASHFLRNTGLGEDLAILDRHIMKNLVYYEIIDSIPEYLHKKIYLEIESCMRNFSKVIGIRLSHLDILFWYKQTGEIFK